MIRKRVEKKKQRAGRMKRRDALQGSQQRGESKGGDLKIKRREREKERRESREKEREREQTSPTRRRSRDWPFQGDATISG